MGRRVAGAGMERDRRRPGAELPLDAPRRLGIDAQGTRRRRRACTREEAHQSVVALEAARPRRPELGARPSRTARRARARRAARSRRAAARRSRPRAAPLFRIEWKSTTSSKRRRRSSRRKPRAARERAQRAGRGAAPRAAPRAGTRAPRRSRAGRAAGSPRGAPPARRAASPGRRPAAPKRPAACAPRRRRRRVGPPGCDRRPAGSLAGSGSGRSRTSRRGVDLWGWAGRILAHAAPPHPHPLRGPRGAAVRRARLPRRRRDPVHAERAAPARRLRLRGPRDPRRAGHPGRPGARCSRPTPCRWRSCSACWSRWAASPPTPSSPRCARSA